MDRPTLRCAAAACLVTLALVSGTYAQCEPTKIASLPDEPIPYNKAVAIDGNIGIFGVAVNREAHVFERSNNGWIVTAVLRPSDGAAAELFGTSVAIEGNVAVVGAPGHDSPFEDSGALYVYERDGQEWEQVSILRPPEPAIGEYLGAAVAVHMGAMIGGATDEGGGNKRGIGQAHVFLRTGWGWDYTQTIRPSDGERIMFFGNAVDIQGLTAMIGAYSDDNDVGNGGSVYFFQQGDVSFFEMQKLRPSDHEQNDQFGISLALDGDVLVVGSNEPCCPDRPGAAYIFERVAGVWAQTKILGAGDGQNGDVFGEGVAISGDTVIVGAPFAALPDATSAGAAYVFHRDQGGPGQWGQVAKLTDDEPNANMQFGQALDASGEILVVSARYGTPFPSSIHLYDIGCGCLADCNDDGIVNTLDFICFLNLYNDDDPLADCTADGNVNTLDFLCFLNAFNEGC